MASELDICNLALSHIGQSRQITAISPPDGSVEAALCANFYYLARAAALEYTEWGFATKRVGLALTGTAPDGWEYQYVKPVNALKIQAVYLDGDNTPQEYTEEQDASGKTVILTNVEDAQAKYTALVTDVNKFSTFIRLAISHFLAGFLAGPIIKGKRGEEVAMAQQQKALMWLGRAALLEADGQREQVDAEPAYTATRVRPRSIRARS